MATDTVYDPQEDSFLLEECSKKYSRGSVLDMGCGSGIQGNAALCSREVREVVYADINQKALEYAKAHMPKTDKKTTFIYTDLFSKIPSRQRFDTIIFNPPYLPDDEFDDEKLITTAGKQGNELILQFLQGCKAHLSIDGQILILFSSLSGKQAIDERIRELKFDKNLIAKQGLFMEQLYVYQLKLHDENIIKGHRGIVEVKDIKIKGRDVKVAIKRSLTSYYDASGEAKFLKILNKKKIGPKLISVDAKGNSITMEYIDGQRIMDYFSSKDSSKEQIIEVISKILGQLFIMDSIGINKLEMTNPYKHIIIRKKAAKIDAVMIDFERCAYTQKPKNVTQFIQFLCSGKLLHAISAKGIFVNKDNLLSIAREYKSLPDKKLIGKIIENIL